MMIRAIPTPYRSPRLTLHTLACQSRVIVDGPRNANPGCRNVRGGSPGNACVESGIDREGSRADPSDPAVYRFPGRPCGGGRDPRNRRRGVHERYGRERRRHVDRDTGPPVAADVGPQSKPVSSRARATTPPGSKTGSNGSSGSPASQTSPVPSQSETRSTSAWPANSPRSALRTAAAASTNPAPAFQGA